MEVDKETVDIKVYEGKKMLDCVWLVSVSSYVKVVNKNELIYDV